MEKPNKSVWIFMVAPCISSNKYFIIQLIHSIIWIIWLLKTHYSYKICSDMFRFTQEPSSGSRSRCLAKIAGMVPPCLLICALPVLWRHIPTCCEWVCVVRCAAWYRRYHAAQGTHISTSTVEPCLQILARHWLRLPDDGSCVNRNMSEQIL